MAVADLGKLVKQKYPGAYDDIPDGTLGRMTIQKYPQYADIAGVNAADVQPTQVQDYQPSTTEKVVTGVQNFFQNTAPGKIGQEIGALIGTHPKSDLLSGKQLAGAALGTGADVAGLLTLNPAILGEGAAGALGTTAGRIGSAAALGAAGNAAGSLGNNQSAGNVAKSAITGAALGAGTAGALEAAGAGARYLGNQITQTAKDVPYSEIKASSAQQKAFFDKTGSTLRSFLENFGITQPGSEPVTKIIEPLQTAFDSIAKNSGVQVPTNTLVDNFQNAIDELNSKTGQAYKNQAKALQQEALNIIDKFGSGNTIDIGDLSNERANYDALTKQFKFDDAQKSINQQTRDVLQKTIQDSTDHLKGPNGESLKQIGQKLNQLYTYDDAIASRHTVTDKSLLKTNLTPLITNHIVGGLLGGAAGASAGHSIKSAITGSLVGGVTPLLMENPKALNALSQAGQFTGNTLSNAGNPALLSLLERLGISAGTGALNNPANH